MRIPNFPEEIQYMLDLAEQYKVTCNEDIFSTMKHLSKEEMEELTVAGERVLQNNHYKTVNAVLGEKKGSGLFLGTDRLKRL